MINLLNITNLHAGTSDRIKILNGINLKVKQGEIHAIMGPNGSGKSTLAHVVMGNPSYILNKGKIQIGTKDITMSSPDQRSKLGLFLAFQDPVGIEGVHYSSFLRMAINSITGKPAISPITFRKELIEKAKTLHIKDDLMHRYINTGFSGGEKKKSEILQMSLLQPKFAVLDEPDSGLDVDGLKYISKMINSIKNSCGLIIISHYQRIFKYLKPDYVHLLINGKIAETGEHTLVKLIEKNGYKSYINR